MIARGERRGEIFAFLVKNNSDPLMYRYRRFFSIQYTPAPVLVPDGAILMRDRAGGGWRGLAFDKGHRWEQRRANGEWGTIDRTGAGGDRSKVFLRAPSCVHSANLRYHLPILEQ
eukprot:scaffold246459_cov36-Tisochrysis_lutea.AAC.3